MALRNLTGQAETQGTQRKQKAKEIEILPKAQYTIFPKPMSECGHAQSGIIPYRSRRLSENGYFPQSLRQTQIIILEILQCIPVVIIFVFLDLGKNISFSDTLLVFHHSHRRGVGPTGRRPITSEAELSSVFEKRMRFLRI